MWITFQEIPILTKKKWLLNCHFITFHFDFTMKCKSELAKNWLNPFFCKCLHSRQRWMNDIKLLLWSMIDDVIINNFIVISSLVVTNCWCRNCLHKTILLLLSNVTWIVSNNMFKWMKHNEPHFYRCHSKSKLVSYIITETL